MSVQTTSSRFTASILIVFAVALGLQHAAISPADAAAPVVASVSSPVQVGGNFEISGSAFSAAATVNFFVSTAAGSINYGPLTPLAGGPTLLLVNVPAAIPLGQGVVALQVINTDEGFAASNVEMALLEGSASAGIPSLTGINGVGLAATSTVANYAVDNVETVVPQGSALTLQGTGFDTVNGVAVDVFCACAAGKVGPFFLNPGDPGLSDTSITLTLPASGPYAAPVGPASFEVSNRGSDGSYSKKSNAVSAPIGRRIQIVSVTQSANELVVDGTGFSTLTVINFYNTGPDGVINLGGMTPGGVPAIAVTLVSGTEIKFPVPAGALPGPSYVQAINPPFLPFTSTGNDPNGAFILTDPAATPLPSIGPTPTPTALGYGPTPTPTPPVSAPTPTSGLPTATPTPGASEAYGMLMTGGLDNTLTASGTHVTIASAETYDETTGVFSASGSMAYARLGHSVTVLNNRTILVAGGHNAFSMRAMPSAELYDIGSGTFSLTGSMNSARLDHAAVLLNNGKVLVAGGQNLDFSAIDLAEVYDPAAGLFSPTASMQNPRISPAAALLNDGTVLIAGGADNNGVLASAELYDANGYGSAAVGSMNTARQAATATLLPNGNVLLAGGASQSASCSRCATDAAEIFNPASRTFTRTGNMHAPRRGHSATLLSDGTVLIAGGVDDTTGAVLASTEIYNPATGTFSQGGDMNVARFQHAAAELGSGKVLMAGGFDGSSTITNTAEIYDPSTGGFTPTANMLDSRAEYGMGCFSLTGSGALAYANSTHHIAGIAVH